ncbi:hypothetical protein GPECTOR_113g290 [Gonium pectorale]|uniref:PH domain-containing protein n=1 Tax=Gonium pectorale TaxID=33097 RepID=A0A150FZ66_GONPE|nr:hypothetical protein GPECTOR_113g290 [Gonium pectorale]|eukprot:KXZ42878.1 hypothetical protein GPECTOR_113g290 [Gonium pectorale]
MALPSAQLSSALRPSDVVKSGELWKQDNFTFWRKHFFVIILGEEPSICLFYQFKDILEQQGKCRFTLEFKDKQRWYLASPSADDRKEWLAAIVGGAQTRRAAGGAPPGAAGPASARHHRDHSHSHHHRYGHGHGHGGRPDLARSSASSPPGSPGRSASPSHSLRTSVGDYGADYDAGEREALGNTSASELSTPRRPPHGATAPASVAGSTASLAALQQQQQAAAVAAALQAGQDGQQHMQQHQQGLQQQHGEHSRRQSIESNAALGGLAPAARGGAGGGGSGGGMTRGRATTLPTSALLNAAGPLASPSGSAPGAAGGQGQAGRPRMGSAAPAPSATPARSSFLKFLWGDGASPAPARQAPLEAVAEVSSPPKRRSYQVAPLGPVMGQLDVLSGKFDGSLVTSSLCEQFDRARTYVDKYPDHFSDQQRAALQNWTEVVERRVAAQDVLLACKALYVLEVTRAQPDWAAADVDGDATFASPEAIIVQVRRLPSAASMCSLKECLDYCSPDWVDVFCRLDGAALLLEVLRSHEGPAREGVPEAIEALSATLQCVQSLTSKPGGMAAVLAVRGFTRAVAGLLRPVDADTTRLALEVLRRMLLFHDGSYRQLLMPNQ